MPKKPHSYGTLLKYGASPTTLTGVRRISGPNVEVSSVDTTDLSSTDAAREFIPGLIDGGQVEFELYADEAVIAALYALLRTETAWDLVFPLQSGEATEAQWDFDGFITSIGEEVEEDEAIIVPITIKVTGKPAFTAAVAA